MIDYIMFWLAKIFAELAFTVGIIFIVFFVSFLWFFINGMIRNMKKS